MNDHDIVSLCNKQLTESKHALGAQRDNTKKCFAFYDADDSSYRDTIQFSDTSGKKKKAEVVFNQIGSNVDTVSGFMAQNRRQAKFTARVNDPMRSMYSKYKNAIYAYHRENTNADQLESAQDKDVLICGYGAIETDLSYIVGHSTTNPYGEIIKLKLDADQVGWDPTAKGMNMLDARWVYYHQDHNLKDALDLFQSSNEEDFEQAEGDEGGNYEYNPYGGVYNKIKETDAVEWEDKKCDRVRVYNHQWFQYENFYRAKNPLYTAGTPEDAAFIKMRLEMIASQVKDLSPDNIETDDMFALDPLAEELVFDDSIKGLLKQEFGEMLQPVSFVRKCYYTAVYSGGHLFSYFKSISQQGFSVKFKTGKYNRTKKIWVGMVNAMIEPQKYHNKSLTELMFTIAANSKGGVMVEKGAVEDIKSFERNYARTDAVITVNEGALSAGKIQEKKSPAIPTGLEQFVSLSEAAITKNGVDPSFMGSLQREDQSGILYKRRIRQVISKMANYFDSITLYQKEDARLSADLIRVWVENNAGQHVRITGEDNQEEFVQVSSDNLVDEYEISIQEAAQTPEDKQETAQLLGSYSDKLLAIGDVGTGKAFLSESLEFLSIDGDVKQRLNKVLQPQETVPMEQYKQLEKALAQIQSQQAQLAMAKTQSEIQKNEVDAEHKKASIQKTGAETVDTLESAKNKALENDLIKTGAYTEAKVSI